MKNKKAHGPAEVPMTLDEIYKAKEEIRRNVEKLRINKARIIARNAVSKKLTGGLDAAMLETREKLWGDDIPSV